MKNSMPPPATIALAEYRLPLQNIDDQITQIPAPNIQSLKNQKLFAFRRSIF